MNHNADTFVFYPSILEQIAQTKNKDIQNALFFAVARYGCYGEMPDFSEIDKFGVLDAAFLPMKYLIDKAKESRKQKSAAGKKGGGQIGNQNARKRTETSRNELNVNGNVYVNGNIEEKSSKKSGNRFSAPSLNDINSYIQEKGYNVDADAFFNYYEANGWKVGQNKMKSWKSAVAMWAAREKSNNHPPSSQPTQREERRGNLEISAISEKDYKTSF